MLTFYEVLARFNARKDGPQWQAMCPAHDDVKESLKIHLGDNGTPIFYCHAKCLTDDVIAAKGLTWGDLLPERPTDRVPVARYDYTDETGALLYQVVRYPPKDFKQRRPDGAGGWIWSLRGVRRVLYRLPELQGQPVVWLVEGEKDADRLRSLGLVATTSVAGAGKWRADYTAQLVAAGVGQVYAIPDHDDTGQAHMTQATRDLQAASVRASVITLPGLPEKGDVSDWLDAGHTIAELQALAVIPPASVATAPAWAALLDATEKGFRSNVTNVVRILQQDPLWGPETLWYDEFLDRTLLANSPIREWHDEDDTRLTVYIQDEIPIPLMGERTVASAVRMVARQRPKHCVRDWLATLTWDGVERLEMAFEDYWGAAPDDFLASPYLRAASRNFFLGLIARVLKPGCKLDTMPVFEGGQGIQKSTALEVLGGEWYADGRETMGTKDFLVSLRGKWLVEISELHAFTRAEVTAIKQTMSTRIDRYRPPYGRAALDYPRQCAFAGTTNAETWGNDETGLRRFWPIRCGGIDIAALRAARSQLFAEAVHAISTGATWWDMPTEVVTAQTSRQAVDDLDEVIRPALLGKFEVTVSDIFDALKLTITQRDKSMQMRVARILKLDGWERKLVKRGQNVYRIWTRVTTSDTTSF